MGSKKLSICVLLPDPFDPNMPSRPAVTEIYGEYLPSFGHEVTWITPSRKKERKLQEHFFKEIKIYTIPYPKASLLPMKIFGLISHLIKKYRLLTTILRREKYDIIQVRNNIFDALLVLCLKKKHNISFVFQYSFPKEVYKVQAKKHHSYYFGRVESFITRYILHKADLIFPISQWMEKELIGKGIPKLKMMPLPMGVNPERFSLNIDGTKIREKYDLSDAKVILYTGTMDKLRKLSIIIYAFSKVREQRDNVKLLMVGDGNDKNNLKELSTKLGISADVIFTGQVSYFDVPYFIAAADICLCPVPPLDIYKVSSPTKMFEYMAMGKPVVANEEIPEQKKVIEESGGGVLVKFEAKSFAEGIMELLDNPSKAKKMERKGYKWVVKNRSYENLAREVVKKYFELLESYKNQKKKIREVK